MARKRDVAPLPATGRPFTSAELARIRHLVAHRGDLRAHPHPASAELDAIHAAAGRQRAFKLWELDPIRTADDYERAYQEEITEERL